MNNRNPSFVPTGPRNYQNTGGYRNNRGKNYQTGNNHWNNKNNQNGYVNANNNWNKRNGSGNSNSNNWTNSFGSHNDNQWNVHHDINGESNNADNENYKGKNFNPNYKGKNFIPNYKGNNPKPEHVHSPSEIIAHVANGNRKYHHQPRGDRYSPYPQRQGRYHNNNHNGSYSLRHDLDIDMVDAPSDEPNDIEMPDAPPLVPDPRIQTLQLSALATKQIAETMIKLLEDYLPSLISN